MLRGDVWRELLQACTALRMLLSHSCPHNKLSSELRATNVLVRCGSSPPAGPQPRATRLYRGVQRAFAMPGNLSYACTLHPWTQ